jgi:hypothetical protein
MVSRLGVKQTTNDETKHDPKENYAKTERDQRVDGWRRRTSCGHGRPSCQDLVTLLRKQIEAQSFGQGTPTNVVGYPSMVQTAAI